MDRKIFHKPSVIIVVFFILFFCGAAGSCSKKPIPIGYLGVMSGKYYDLGIAGRNGAKIAIDRANRSGGIRGRQLELVIEDSELDPDAAIAAADRLLERNIQGLIGPMTSDVSLAVLPLFNEKEVVMISPTASTPKLSGLDDYFFRVNPPDSSEAKSMADFFIANQNLTSAVVVYDLVNSSFTEGLATAFGDVVDGRKPVQYITFDSSAGTNFIILAHEIEETGSDVLFLLGTSADSANILQQLKKIEYDPVVLLTGWAMTEEFISEAGDTADGALFNHYHDINSKKPAYLDFVLEYKEQYGSDPDFVAALGYNAAAILIEAIREREDSGSVKSYLLEKRQFEGLQGQIVFTDSGDCDLERNFITIDGGKFVPFK